MRKWLMLVMALAMLSLMVISLLGCAARRPILTRNALTSGPIDVVIACKDPETLVRPTHEASRSVSQGFASQGSAAGGIFAIIAHIPTAIWEKSTRDKIQKTNPPALYQLVMEQLSLRINRISDTSQFIVHEQLIGGKELKALMKRPTGMVMVLTPGGANRFRGECCPIISTANGIEYQVVAQLFRQGEVVWAEGFTYISVAHRGSFAHIKYLEQNNWQPLPNELRICAVAIAETLVIKLKRACDAAL
jgi:hypothetical protein